jgi:hypothetical protein
VGPRARLDTAPTALSLTPDMIHQEIRTLLAAPPTGEDAPSLYDLEDTLTAGYARALALEAEHRRLERKLAEVAAALSEAPDGKQAELAMLGQRLSAADGDLISLRRLLVSLRTRADEVRTSPQCHARPAGSPELLTQQPSTRTTE